MIQGDDTLCLFDKCSISDNCFSGIEHGGTAEDLLLIDTTVCGNFPNQIIGYWTDGGGNSIQDVCGSAGACCLPDATCQNVDSEKACVSLGGVYNGDEVHCSDSPCVPSGACCLDDAICIDLLEELCINLGGLYQDGTECAESPCVRACCIEDKICFDMLVSDCIVAGGDFHEFRMCESSPCVTSWTVDDDGKADFDNIQAAVDASTDGDEILVYPGTYMGTHPGHVVDMLGKEVWLHSSEGPEVTIIDGENVRRGLSCINGETNSTVIEGFTITNGYSVAYDSDGDGEIAYWEDDGGGIQCIFSSPTISDCIISSNNAHVSVNSWGAGIAFYEGSAA